MSNSNQDLWDSFPGVRAAIASLQEAVQPLSEAKEQIESIYSKISETLQFYHDSISAFYDGLQQFHDRFLEIGKAIEGFASVIQVIEKLANAQYVCWEYLTPDFVEDLIDTSDTDEVLEKHLERDGYDELYRIAADCTKHPIIHNNRTTLEQAIDAMRVGHNNLSIVGIIATIDGALSCSTHDTSTGIYCRAQKLLNKLSTEEALDETELALTILFITFERTMTTFSANKPFDDDEPTILNRHWIMHGRSSKAISMLDCAKMIRFLYGILLLNDLPVSS